MEKLTRRVVPSREECQIADWSARPSHPPPYRAAVLPHHRPRLANEVLRGHITEPVTVTGRALSWDPVAVHVAWYEGWRQIIVWLPA